MKQAAFLGIAIAAGCLLGANTLSAVCNNGLANGNTACGDTTIAFTASGGFEDGATLSGILDIDITLGSVTGGDLTIVGGDVGSAGVTFTGSPSPAGSFASNTTWNDVEFQAANAADTYILSLSLDLSNQNNTGSLLGYAGGNLCTTADNCNNGSGTNYLSSYSISPVLQPCQPGTCPTGQLPGDPNLTSGTLSTGTPEPSSFLLMAAPALWFGIRRRRRRT